MKMRANTNANFAFFIFQFSLISYQLSWSVGPRRRLFGKGKGDEARLG